MMVDSGSSIQKVDSGDSIVAFQPDPADFFDSIGPRPPVRRVCFHGEFRKITGRGSVATTALFPFLRGVLATRQSLPTDSDMFKLEYLPAEPWRPS